ncbi:hypothetical protein WT27_06950 [Burkholderia territorii]|uniref:Uncharacterized protein n=1 Tax=Burkholderia territorii TaxID=1503055 RepID=A0A105VDM2_9BURK|nr:hypothetical protein WT27_06950 [Burkholderia territorii]KVX38727.1 hypothetical protein WT31_03185 [Burkholderia territorii]
MIEHHRKLCLLGYSENVKKELIDSRADLGSVDCPEMMVEFRFSGVFAPDPEMPIAIQRNAGVQQIVLATWANTTTRPLDTLAAANHGGIRKIWSQNVRQNDANLHSRDVMQCQ